MHTEDLSSISAGPNGTPPAPCDARFRHKDGTVVWVSVTATTLVDPHGQYTGAFGMVTDITARRGAEEALRRAAATNSQLAAAIDTLASGVVITDPHQPGDPIVFANPAFLAMSGYAWEEVLGQPCRFMVGPDTDPLTLQQITAALAAPRPFHGVVRHYRRDGTPFWNDLTITPVHAEGGRLTHFVGLHTDVSVRVQMEEDLRRQALHDALTGLPNRALLRDRLEQAVRDATREHTSLALFLLDLDRFKEVNDTLGHDVGDRLLQEVGRRVHGVLRATDTVARLGGDEFAVLLPRTDADGAQRAARGILATLTESVMLGEQWVAVGASVGGALVPAQAPDAATALRYADVAMYTAKRSGDGYALYAPEQDQHTPGRLALTGALRQALVHDDLRVHYQPTLDVSTGQVTGVEALVRWQHPEQGLLPPDRFIPLAEQTGLIKPLTRWVLDTALRDCRAWDQEGLALNVAVNLSACNLLDPDLVETVAGLLAAHAVPPPRLCLELTETAIMADAARATAVLLRLAALGVRIAIDDFGTGYSSLAYLKRLPVDVIKIDRSFVMHMASDEDDATIVASTIGLGHSLGLSFVAEGVENRETWTQLAALGCDVGQGYYLSHPLPARDLTRWLRDRRTMPVGPQDQDAPGHEQQARPLPAAHL